MIRHAVGITRRGMATFIALFFYVLLAQTADAQSLPSGLTYVWWDMGRQEFEDFQIDITIHNDLESRPGMYFQMYQGRIGPHGFYFGLQTDVYRPRKGGQGKGLIFSRWGTRSLEDVRATSDGWVQSAGYEGDFVGVRKPYAWTAGKYRLRLTRIDQDKVGAWYGFFILDYKTGTEDYAGAIRFPLEKDGSVPRIQNGGVTWTEIYSGVSQLSELPDWHLTIDGVWIENKKHVPRKATSNYSKVPGNDIAYDAEHNTIHFRLGAEVPRRHEPGVLYEKNSVATRKPDDETQP